MMVRVSLNATEQINITAVRDRRRVHAYYPYLWVWHRLNDARWKQSSIPMREKRKRTSKLEVDHTIADALWGRLVNQAIEKKTVDFVGSDEEKALLAPDEFESRVDAFAFINSIGNCSLLEKSFNISKLDKPMWTFLQNVHEFIEGKIQRSEWEEALSLSETFTDPENASLAVIKEAILARESLIRKELTEFIAGSKLRVDVD